MEPLPESRFDLGPPRHSGRHSCPSYVEIIDGIPVPTRTSGASRTLLRDEWHWDGVLVFRLVGDRTSSGKSTGSRRILKAAAPPPPFNAGGHERSA